MGENDTTNGVEEKKDNIQVISEKGNDKDNNNDSTNGDNNMSFLKKMKQIKCLPPKATWHLWLWGIANITLIAYLVFSFSLMTEKNVNGAVQTALWILTIAGIMYSMLGTLAISSSLRSRFTFGAFVGSSAFLSSQMFLISIIAGGDLAVNDRDDQVDAPERGVSIFSFILSIVYISLSALMWVNQKVILKSWKIREKLPLNSHLAGEFDEIELI